jgi:methyl-accepting chemotaxis protein
MANVKEMSEEQKLASFWNMKFKDAMVAKAPYVKEWNTYFNAYYGDYFKNVDLPDYKSNFVANYIWSVVETIRPIMVDHDPKFQALPRQPEGAAFADDLQEALSYEWDRECMTEKLYRDLIMTLVTGTSVYFLSWDEGKKEIKCTSVSPYNLFPDPLATSVKDAEYLIYASYKNADVLKRAFPKHAEKISGGQINYGELVRDNNKNARVDNQVLVLEVYTRDYERNEVQMKDYKVLTMKYPKGRIITICPELGIVLADRHNPYDDGEFPFELLKDYDIPGKFWGIGEVKQLLSPQQYMNELNNAILDNAKATANMPWIIDKNAGIPQGGLKARPGLVVRKNPGSEVRREQAPSMPNYVVNAVETYKHDMEQVSGIFDSLKGNSETGVYTAQGILALQEAGQARVRLKVKLMEQSLGKLACKWFSRMKQFWKQDKWMRITRIDGSYDFKKYTTSKLKYDYDIKITAGSTMPVNRGAMLDLMIRLAQTPMPDGQNLVDREAVAHYLPQEINSALIRRMGDKQAELEQVKKQLDQVVQQFQQLVQENQKNDQQTLQTVEQVASAIEGLNKKILQLQGEHDTLVEEQKKQEEINKIKDQSFNEGFQNAEKRLSDSSGGNVQQDLGMPQDLLNGIQGMSDDELELLMMQHPELQDLIK